jgi:hypothetical protein
MIRVVLIDEQGEADVCNVRALQPDSTLAPVIHKPHWLVRGAIFLGATNISHQYCSATNAPVLVPRWPLCRSAAAIWMNTIGSHLLSAWTAADDGLTGSVSYHVPTFAHMRSGVEMLMTAFQASVNTATMFLTFLSPLSAHNSACYSIASRSNHDGSP